MPNTPSRPSLQTRDRRPSQHKFMGIANLEWIDQVKACLNTAVVWFQSSFGHIRELPADKPLISVVFWDPLVPFPKRTYGNLESHNGKNRSAMLKCPLTYWLDATETRDACPAVIIPTSHDELWGKAFENNLWGGIAHEAWHALLWRWLNRQTNRDRIAWEEGFAVAAEWHMVPDAQSYLAFARKWLIRGRDGIVEMIEPSDGYVEFPFVVYIHEVLVDWNPENQTRWIGDFWNRLELKDPNATETPLGHLRDLLASAKKSLDLVFLDYCRDSWFAGDVIHRVGRCIPVFSEIFSNFGRRVPVLTVDLRGGEWIRPQALCETNRDWLKEEHIAGYAVRYYHFVLGKSKALIEFKLATCSVWEDTLVVRGFGETKDGHSAEDLRVELSAGVKQVCLPEASDSRTHATVMLCRTEEADDEVAYWVRVY